MKSQSAASLRVIRDCSVGFVFSLSRRAERMKLHLWMKDVFFGKRSWLFLLCMRQKEGEKGREIREGREMRRMFG